MEDLIYDHIYWSLFVTNRYTRHTTKSVFSQKAITLEKVQMQLSRGSTQQLLKTFRHLV